MRKLSRRRFLQTAAVATAATQLAPRLTAESAATALPYPENGTLIPDDGWHLWIDDKAEWQNDDLFLPEDVSWIPDGDAAKLCGKGQPLPVNPPTGGWGVLMHAGKEVTLPTTVEQHFWGKYGAGADGKPRPYTPDEYRYAATTPPVTPADDAVPQNGAYFGVSWWTRSIDMPAEMRGKRIFLHIRGARLRAEVYLNQQLVGYSIMEELPFECDLTHAANPGGLNLLAIRLTNPFGRFDWVDGSNAKWGHLALYRSHGFGGLDRGMTISAHTGNRITDAWVLNSPQHENFSDIPTVIAYAVIPIEGINAGDDLQRDTAFGLASNLTIRISDRKGKVFDPDCRTLNAELKHGFELRCQIEVTVSGCALWDLNSPILYDMHLTYRSVGYSDTRTIAFGFRSFAPDDLGTNALFRLNGRRIRIYTAISWGYWGLNGLFPVPELSEKEVVAAKALGLNCLNFHRNLAKEDVLRKHDELGVLRYMEPGAGKLAIGKLPANVANNAPDIVMEKPTTEADKFAQRYMFTKCVAMVKAYRSHPSVIEYCLQNEIGADLNNPDTLAILKAMHDEDPSRCVVLNDGFVARGAAQAWYAPWGSELNTTENEAKIHRSDQEPWGGWWNNHQGAGDQWVDAFYKSPTDFTYNSPEHKALSEYGEMEGCARPDNHSLMVHQITETYKKYGGNSYDLIDHEEIIAGYDRFLDKWGFRAAFPTAESVFLACGLTEYQSWQNYMENARLSDDLDFAAISGWESTAIENHSGIVDNLRNFKSDPKLIAGSLLPVRPIAKQRALCIEQGQPATFDLFLANDTGKPATGELVFTVITTKGTRTELFRCPTPAQTPDVFTYLLKEAFVTPPLNEEGLYRFQFSLSSAPLSTQTKEVWVTGVGQEIECNDAPFIAICGITSELRKQLQNYGDKHCLSFVDFDPNYEKRYKYRAVITSGLTAQTSATQSVGETTGTEAHPTTAAKKPEALGQIDPAILDAVRAGTPLLCIPQTDALSDGCAQQLAAAGAFAFHGNVGGYRAPWMGNWYFGREHAIFDGLPTNAALGNFYQIPARQSNGLLIDAAPGQPAPEILIAYSRDHDRQVGAGTFTTSLGKGKVLYHRTPEFHPVLQARFLANALRWLTA
jgi:hypothetical protein